MSAKMIDITKRLELISQANDMVVADNIRLEDEVKTLKAQVKKLTTSLKKANAKVEDLELTLDMEIGIRKALLMKSVEQEQIFPEKEEQAGLSCKECAGCTRGMELAHKLAEMEQLPGGKDSLSYYSAHKQAQDMYSECMNRQEHAKRFGKPSASNDRYRR